MCIYPPFPLSGQYHIFWSCYLRAWERKPIYTSCCHIPPYHMLFQHFWTYSSFSFVKSVSTFSISALQGLLFSAILLLFIAPVGGTQWVAKLQCWSGLYYHKEYSWVTWNEVIWTCMNILVTNLFYILFFQGSYSFNLPLGIEGLCFRSTKQKLVLFFFARLEQQNICPPCWIATRTANGLCTPIETMVLTWYCYTGKQCASGWGQKEPAHPPQLQYCC